MHIWSCIAVVIAPIKFYKISGIIIISLTSQLDRFWTMKSWSNSINPVLSYMLPAVTAVNTRELFNSEITSNVNNCSSESEALSLYETAFEFPDIFKFDISVNAAEPSPDYSPDFLLYNGLAAVGHVNVLTLTARVVTRDGLAEAFSAVGS